MATVQSWSSQFWVNGSLQASSTSGYNPSYPKTFWIDTVDNYWYGMTNSVFGYTKLGANFAAGQCPTPDGTSYLEFTVPGFDPITTTVSKLVNSIISDPIAIMTSEQWATFDDWSIISIGVRFWIDVSNEFTNTLYIQKGSSTTPEPNAYYPTGGETLPDINADLYLTWEQPEPTCRTTVYKDGFSSEVYFYACMVEDANTEEVLSESVAPSSELTQGFGGGYFAATNSYYVRWKVESRLYSDYLNDPNTYTVSNAGNWNYFYFLDPQLDTTLYNNISVTSSSTTEIHSSENSDSMRVIVIRDNSIDITMELEWEQTERHFLDLLPLVPLKFHNYPFLVEFIREELSVEIARWISYIKGIPTYLNPNTCTDSDSLVRLGQLIGLNFPSVEDMSTTDLQNLIASTLDWYKIKGTYRSVEIVAHLASFTVNIWDMWTDDYSTFVDEDWWSGNVGEYPIGLDENYYKSPHFSVEVLLNQTYGSGSTMYLWTSDKMTNLQDLVEETRPVHTVPHYRLLLNPKTDEFQHTIEVEGDILARVTNGWQVSAGYFDDSESGGWSFDDGGTFDSSLDVFLSTIDKWVIGTGNKVSTINDSSFIIENEVVNGSLTTSNITVDTEKVSFDILIPREVYQDGISEFGLYISDTNTLVAGATFPYIDKDSSTELRVLFQVYFRDLT